MTEKEDNRVHFLLDHLNVTRQVTLNEEDMLLILRHQRELGIEEGKRMASEKQIPKDVRIDGYGWYECPDCHNKRPNWLLGKDAKWCPYCGQKLD